MLAHDRFKPECAWLEGSTRNWFGCRFQLSLQGQRAAKHPVSCIEKPIRNSEGDFFVLVAAIKIRILPESRFHTLSLLHDRSGLISEDRSLAPTPEISLSPPIRTSSLCFYIGRGGITSQGFGTIIVVPRKQRTLVIEFQSRFIIERFFGYEINRLEVYMERDVQKSSESKRLRQKVSIPLSLPTQIARKTFKSEGQLWLPSFYICQCYPESAK